MYTSVLELMFISAARMSFSIFVMHSSCSDTVSIPFIFWMMSDSMEAARLRHSAITSCPIERSRGVTPSASYTPSTV